MNLAWSWFLAKTIVFPNRSPPATFTPLVIRCPSTLSTVSSLNSHLLTASASTRSGTLPSSSHSSASHLSLSSSERSSYLIPSRWNFSGTETERGGTRKPSLTASSSPYASVGTPFSRSNRPYVLRSTSSLG